MRTAAVLVVLASVVVVAAATGPVVSTTSGKVMGFRDDNYQGWLGIPFAATTGGANRFMPPQPRAAWAPSVFNATQWGPGCYQTHHNADVPKELSEDCLSVNVFAPSWANASSNLPVMLFFYGGSFVEGSNQGPFFMYDGGYIAGNKPVIVVTGNYRLGALGWAVTNDIPGNMGFRDQIACMKWVQSNIKGFGGNADDVTLWGESAGAMSGGLHLVSPASKGLFHKLIMESNPSGFRYRTQADMQLYGQDMCTVLGCNVSDTCNTTCMQQAPVATVGDAWNKAGNDWIAIVFGNWGHWLDAFLATIPVIDADLIPENPQVALPAGNFNKGVPVLLGTNNNEGSTFVYAGLSDPTPTAIFEFLTWGIFGDLDKQIFEHYNITSLDPMADGRTWFSRVLTDYWFRCASEVFATAVTNSGSKAFVYRFDHVYEDANLFSKFGLPSICDNRTCHATELPMVFHFTHLVDKAMNVSFTMTPVEVALSQSFVDYWTSFAIYGDPNTGNPSQPTWPTYTPSGRQNIVLQDTIASENAVELCTFWDGIGYLH